MEKYLLKNWTTFPFKRKTFDGQMDRFAKVCVVSLENPSKVLDIVPIYGNENSSGLRDIIRLIYDIEKGKTIGNDAKQLLSALQEPVLGKFESVESLHGPLFHQFTPDEAKYGLCSANDVWKPERDNQGKVKEYLNMKVFTIINYDSEFGKFNYANGWSPSQMYYKYYGYRYLPFSKLTEPIQF